MKPKKIKLKCANCGKTGEFNDRDSAFNEGWDFAPYFSIGKVMTCPNCPTSPMLLWEKEKPKDR